jgi:hypothetical protein
MLRARIVVGDLHLQPAALAARQPGARCGQQRLAQAAASRLRTDEQLIDLGHQAAVLEAVDGRSASALDAARISMPCMDYSESLALI